MFLQPSTHSFNECSSAWSTADMIPGVAGTEMKTENIWSSQSLQEIVLYDNEDRSN